MIVVSWDGHAINDGANYEAGFLTLPQGLPAVEARPARRTNEWPLLSGLERRVRELTLDIKLLGNRTTQLLELAQWFDPEDEEPKQLVALTAAGKPVFVEAICEELREEPYTAGGLFVVRLAVHGDVRWRAVQESEEEWEITASGQTVQVATEGDEAFPTLVITPGGAKTGGYAYKRWYPVRWQVDEGAARYPVNLTSAALDTETLVSAGKMQADGDDLRVLVNGVEVDRWLDDINTPLTAVWALLDFVARQETALAAAIAGAGVVDTIDVSGSIGQFPASGILMIDDEAFVYTGKNNALRRFTGVTRAARGTSAAAHSAGADVWWVQHDIWLLYGNASAGAPPANAALRPVFELDSSNAAWTYEEFAAEATDPPRPGSWQSQGVAPHYSFYDGEEGTAADPAEVLGISVWPTENEKSAPMARRLLHNPCGISGYIFSDAKKRRPALPAGAMWRGAVEHSANGVTWTEATILAPGDADSWEGWSDADLFLPVGTRFLALRLALLPGTGVLQPSYVEAGTVVAHIVNAPLVIPGAEQGNYLLDCRITNETTGEAVGISFVMAPGESLTVDTETGLATYSEDGRSYFGAMTVVGAPRRRWLALAPKTPAQPGLVNTLRFDDAGTTDVEIEIVWRERHYG